MSSTRTLLFCYKDWTKANGKKVGDIKDITLYVKPEEAAVYYVVNGTDSGKVAY